MDETRDRHERQEKKGVSQEMRWSAHGCSRARSLASGAGCEQGEAETRRLFQLYISRRTEPLPEEMAWRKEMKWWRTEGVSSSASPKSSSVICIATRLPSPAAAASAARSVFSPSCDSAKSVPQLRGASYACGCMWVWWCARCTGARANLTSVPEELRTTGSEQQAKQQVLAWLLCPLQDAAAAHRGGLLADEDVAGVQVRVHKVVHQQHLQVCVHAQADHLEETGYHYNHTLIHTILDTPYAVIQL